MWIIFKNWQLIAIGLLVATTAAMGFYINLLQSQKLALIAEKNAIVAQLEVSQASVKNLQSAINEQNTAIEKLKFETDERAKSSAVAIAKAKITAENYKKQASVLLMRTFPQNVSKCDAANLLINEEIKNAK